MVLTRAVGGDSGEEVCVDFVTNVYYRLALSIL